MTTVPASFPAYFVAPFSAAQKATLLAALNQPNKQFMDEDVVQDSGVDSSLVLGKTIEEVIAVHKQLAPECGWDLERSSFGGLLIVLDERTLAEFEASGEEAATVELVYLSITPDRRLRASIPQAVGVWTSLEAGTLDWEDFEEAAEQTNGVLTTLDA